MNMKKRLFTLALALVLALSLAACGGRSDAPADDSTPPQTEAPEVPETPEGETPTAPAPEAPEDQEPEVPAPGDGENTAPEGGEAQIDLTGFYNTLREENTWPELMDLADESMAELLESYYPGLSEIPAKQRGVYIAAIAAAVGEIALVEVEDAGDVQAVKDIFQARIDYQVGDDSNPGGAWYPETIEGWKTKSHIVSSGNYVMLAVGDSAAAAVERFEGLFA